MPLPMTLLLLAALLMLALLLQPAARSLRLPFSLLLVLTGFAGSELVVALGYDTGLRAESFHDLILYVFLPALVFESAFRIDARALLRDLALILVVAVPVLMLSILIAAFLVFHGIGHPSGFPWIAALLTGALLSATDPVAVVDLFKRLGVPERLTVLMEGESLFNDATAIVVFGIFLAIALAPAQAPTLADAALRFALLFFGGALTGLAVGVLCLLLMRRFHDPVEQGLLTLVGAYAAFLSAEWLLHVSGIMAVLVTGLIMGRAVHKAADTHGEGFIDRLWTLNAFIANALVFLLMGATVTVTMFEERWLAMLIGIGAVLIARALGLLAILPLAGAVPGITPVPLRLQAAMYWGGLRGAVTLALALSLPVGLDYWWTIQSIAFGVVLFTLAVQAPTMPVLLRGLGLARRQ